MPVLLLTTTPHLGRYITRALEQSGFDLRTLQTVTEMAALAELSEARPYGTQPWKPEAILYEGHSDESEGEALLHLLRTTPYFRGLPLVLIGKIRFLERMGELSRQEPPVRVEFLTCPFHSNELLRILRPLPRDPESTDAEPDPTPTSIQQPKQLLLVTTRDFIREILEKFLGEAGYSMRVMASVTEVAELAQERRSGEAPDWQPDLIICDAPKGSTLGRELLTLAQNQPLIASRPLVFLSAGNTLDELFEQLRNGPKLPFWYVTQPFHPSELVQLLQRIFQEQALDETGCEPPSPNESPPTCEIPSPKGASLKWQPLLAAILALAIVLAFFLMGRSRNRNP